MIYLLPAYVDPSGITERFAWHTVRNRMRRAGRWLTRL